jgi:hypothetical protein
MYVPSRSHLYLSIQRDVRYAAVARLREFESNRIIPDVQIFNSHEVILFRVVVRQLLEEVPTFLVEVSVTFRNPPSLLFVVVQPMLLLRELPLFAFQSLAFVQGRVTNHCSVGVVDVLANPKSIPITFSYVSSFFSSQITYVLMRHSIPLPIFELRASAGYRLSVGEDEIRRESVKDVRNQCLNGEDGTISSC